MAGILKLVVCTVILAFVVPRIIKLVQVMKFDKVVYSHEPGPCQLIPGIEHGSEDMQALPNGMVFISSGLKQIHAMKHVKGQVMLFDHNAPQRGAVPLQIDGDLDMGTFNPHGISIWQEKGMIKLFVINHLPSTEVVEIFSFDAKKPTKLLHEETIESEAFLCPNDIVAVGPRQFYLTNYLRFFTHGSPFAALELFSLLKLGTIAFYDGKNSRIVADGLIIANGIAKSLDGKYIYAVSFGDQEIHVYKRNADQDLTLIQSFAVGGPVDNIDVHPETGDIWAGVHQKPSALIKNIEDYTKPAPSQVLQLKIKDGVLTDIIEVYSEDGTKYISGSSVAISYKDKLMVGTVNNKAIICDILHLK